MISFLQIVKKFLLKSVEELFFMSAMVWTFFCFPRITKITITIKINNIPPPVPTKTYIKESAKKRAVLLTDRQTSFLFVKFKQNELE